MPNMPIEFVFLMSSERSGSNLITRLIGAHPEICAPAPTHLFRVLAGNLHRYSDLSCNDAWRALISDAVELFNAKSGEWRTRLTVDQVLASCHERSLGAVLSAIYTAEAQAQNRGRVFVKENQVHEFFGFLEGAFPNARYVYLARDPRDMALSWKRAAALRGGVVRAARTWKSDQQGFLRMAAWLGPTDRVFRVQYETLVSDTQGTLERLCGFLGVPFSEGMLDYHRKDDVRRDAAAVTDWQNIAAPIMAENFGKYQAGMSKQEVDYVEAVCNEEMRLLGYEPVRFDGSLNLAEVERTLEQQELGDKEIYRSVSEAERQMRRAWREAYDRIVNRTIAQQT